VTPDVTHESVAAHLAQSVEGTPVPFDDETLSGISDIAKIKKAYKLGALSSAPSDKADGTNGEDRRLELSVIGAIALRGAT
jgi:EKC/KEOPS complex subunit CGI121/TPRKB